MKTASSTSSPLTPLRISIAELNSPLGSYSCSTYASPVDWAQKNALKAFPPITPPPSESPKTCEAPSSPSVCSDRDGIDLADGVSAVLPLSPKAPPSDTFEASSPTLDPVSPSSEPASPVSSLELIAPSPSHTDIMSEVLLPHTGFAPSPLTPAGPSSLMFTRSFGSARNGSHPLSAGSLAARSSPRPTLASFNRLHSHKTSRLYRRPSSTNVTHIDHNYHHSKFYMSDDMVILSVDSCLYRVHRYNLEHESEYFRRLFQGCGRIDIPSGSTDDTAIPIPEVNQQEFDCLMNFMYHKIYDGDLMSLEDWIVLLGVSTKLLFLKLRKRAIVEITAQLDSVGAVEAIVLASQHDVPEWLGPAYSELCRRGHALDEYEAEQLGARVAARIARAREMIREEAFGAFTQRRYGAAYTSPETYDGELVSRVVEEVFWPEIA